MEKRPSGKYVAYSGSELADRIECVRGQNGVAEAIHGFRGRVSEAFDKEANISCDRFDIVQSGGPGYRLKEWITAILPGVHRTRASAAVAVPVGAPDDPVNAPVTGPGDPVNGLDDPVNVSVNVPDGPDALNERQL